jgi:hypothetical protein
MEDFTRIIVCLLREVRRMPLGRLVLMFLLVVLCILAWQSPQIIVALR